MDRRIEMTGLGFDGISLQRSITTSGKVSKKQWGFQKNSGEWRAVGKTVRGEGRGGRNSESAKAKGVRKAVVSGEWGVERGKAETVESGRNSGECERQWGVEGGKEGKRLAGSDGFLDS